MKETERRAGIARENALQWALQTATLGEDPMAILARAQLYEEYILAAGEAAGPGRCANAVVKAD